MDHAQRYGSDLPQRLYYLSLRCWSAGHSAMLTPLVHLTLFAAPVAAGLVIGGLWPAIAATVIEAALFLSQASVPGAG